MKYLFAGLLFVLVLWFLIFSRYKKDLFRQVNKKEHPLRFLYPAAGRLTDLFRRIFSGDRNGKVQSMLKSLYVKENVEKEAYLYSVKKTATILLVLFGISILGSLVCFFRGGGDLIRMLERNEPGKGTQSYDLQVDFRGTEEDIQISVEEEKYSREEILALFEESLEPIEKEALGENPDQEHVSLPLTFPYQYGPIRIFWEIEDTDIVGYNGEIRAELEEGESLVLNLFATLTLDSVSQTYNFPVVICAPEKTEKDRLIAQILESIKENNSIYEKDVRLPDTLNGTEIFFHSPKEKTALVILLLGVAAVIFLVFGYDRSLEKKLQKRREEMTVDFTEIVSKLSLLYEAGSSILKAWEKIVSDQEKKGRERYAYKEMKLALEKIKSGVRERDAYSEFGKRCGLHSYIKLGNILDQNLSKGTKGMKLLLKQETTDAFEERKRIARKKGEEAGTKLLVPMILMMILVIVIIAVPALMAVNL